MYRVSKCELPMSRLSKVIVWQTDRHTESTTPLRGWSITHTIYNLTGQHGIYISELTIANSKFTIYSSTCVQTKIKYTHQTSWLCKIVWKVQIEDTILLGNLKKYRIPSIDRSIAHHLMLITVSTVDTEILYRRSYIYRISGWYLIPFCAIMLRAPAVARCRYSHLVALCQSLGALSHRVFTRRNLIPIVAAFVWCSNDCW